MFTALLAILLAAPVGSRPVIAPVAASDTQAAAIRLTLNREEYGTGDPVRAQVETGEDGYLIVMRVDGDGRIRVIFPLDPTGDAFVRGGKRYELRGRSESETFKADDLGGAGIVFAALASDPLSFKDFAKSGHWDYEALRVTQFRDDPEAELHRFVRLMSNEGKYAFDVKGYRVVVAASQSYSAYAPVYFGGYDPFCGSGIGYGRRFGVSMGMGSMWDPYYDPYAYSAYGCDGFRYDPYFAYGYSPYYSPYYPGQYAPYTPFLPFPRPVPNRHVGERARPRPGILTPHVGNVTAVPPSNPRPVVPAGTPDGRARPRQNSAAPATGGATAPARPATPQVAPNIRGGIPVPTQPRSRPTPATTSGGTAASRGWTTQRLDGPRPVFRDPTPVPTPQVRRDPAAAARPVYRVPDRTAPVTAASRGTTDPRPPASADRSRPTQAPAQAPAARVAPPPPPPPPPASAPRVTAPPPPPPPPATRARAGSGG